MSFIRPDLLHRLSRWREVLAALAVVAAGLWLARLGGPVLAVLGGGIAVVAAALAVLAARRLRFRLEIGAPGAVEIDEGRISYLGPVTGGAVSLADLVGIDVIDVAGGRRCWRLHQADGQVLLVPLAAAGAAALYDHFVALPGMETRRLMAALEGEATIARPVWRRRATAERTVRG